MSTDTRVMIEMRHGDSAWQAFTPQPLRLEQWSEREDLMGDGGDAQRGLPADASIWTESATHLLVLDGDRKYDGEVRATGRQQAEGWVRNKGAAWRRCGKSPQGYVSDIDQRDHTWAPLDEFAALADRIEIDDADDGRPHLRMILEAGL